MTIRLDDTGRCSPSPAELDLRQSVRHIQARGHRERVAKRAVQILAWARTIALSDADQAELGGCLDTLEEERAKEPRHATRLPRGHLDRHHGEG